MADPTAPGADGATFADKDLEHLLQRGFFDTLVGLVKGGKEATVYLVRSGEERLAAKVYADIESRTFRNDSRYWAGVHIADQRVAKALKKRSRTGRVAQQSIWAAREYTSLWRLVEAGVPVPRPLLGPAVSEFAEAGKVVLMEFIGDGDTPAPRLSDVRLEPEEAESAYAQSVDILLHLARLGLVHGDFSTYNLLWHEGKVILIDVPQMLEAEAAGRQGRELLERDVASLLTSFRRLRVEGDAEALRREVLAALP